MKLVVTGVTGTAGAAALKAALADARVTRVVALARRAPAVTHEKLTVVVHEDFLDYARVDLSGLDACLWCLGVSQSRVTKDEYQRITVDYTLAGARAMAAASPGLTFCYLSGQGADSSEKSRITFARVKGRAENRLLAESGLRAYCFRPGYIHPAEPAPHRTAGEKAFGVLAPLLRLSKGLMCDAPRLAAAMLAVARDGHEKRILENRDLLALAGG